MHPLTKFWISLFLLVTFLLNCKKSLGQAEPKAHYGFKISGLYGYHFAPNVVEKTGMSLNGFVKGLEFSLLKYGLQKQSFMSVYGKPALGLNAKFFQMNNQDTFGLSLGILPVYELPVLAYKNLFLAARIGYGLNLNNVQYHRQHNFDNRAISSAVNFGFDVGASLKYRLKNKFEFELNSGLYHVSNGSLKMPNGGINIVYGSAGICYFPNGTKANAYIKPNYKDTVQKWQLSTQFAIGYRELGYFDNVTKFWVASASTNYVFNVNKLYAVGLGLDAFYDATQGLLEDQKLRVRDIKEYQKYHLALGLYHRFTIGKLFLPFGAYHYIAPLQYINEPIYIRFGLGYQFHKKIYTGLFFKGTINNKLKLQSDFMEWAIGVRI